jgi:hypothetical protein
MKQGKQKMGEMFIVIKDDLEKAVRDKAYERFGPKKGYISKALDEALRMWLKAEHKGK